MGFQSKQEHSASILCLLRPAPTLPVVDEVAMI